MLPIQIGQKISGTAEKLIFGGSCLIRHKGIVIFVPYLIPGEKALIEITKIKARYAEGKVLRIEEPSENRVKPLCPYFGTCGGCQLQHINLALHSSLKKEMLREALHKILPKEMDFDIVSADKTFGWRRKITLHAQWKRGFSGCGFIADDNATLIPISWCPLFFSDQEKTFLPRLTSIIEKIQGSISIDLTLFRLPEKGIFLSVSGNNALPSRLHERMAKELSALPHLLGFSLRFPNQRYDSGQGEFTFQALSSTWHCSTDAFIQNHPTLSERLWGDIITIVDQSGKNQRILDLYSGIGVTAISLNRRGHSVIAVELSETAVDAAKRSATDSEGEKRLELLHSSVEEFLPKFKGISDWWIVNPPRTGLSKEVISQILTKQPAKLLYVSCSPPTLARDLAHISNAGWHMVQVQGYDMFPQTTHFETIAVLERTKGVF